MNLGKGSFSFTELPENVIVGKYSSIAKDCHFHDSGTHLYEGNKKVVYTINWDQIRQVKPIIIGNDVWICEGARILTGVTIHDGTIIGAGAVIAKDVPAYAVVIGNPQQIIKHRFSGDQVDSLLKVKWWDWDEDTIKARKGDMKDIDLFLQKYE
jgi:acetyltransferase-like isoleucine patch superfamily enzyme